MGHSCSYFEEKLAQQGMVSFLRTIVTVPAPELQLQTLPVFRMYVSCSRLLYIQLRSGVFLHWKALLAGRPVRLVLNL